MQRGQLRDISSWMTRLFPEPSERMEAFKMFGSKTSCPTSTFYTDLEITESKEVVTEEYEGEQCSKTSRSFKQQSVTNEDGNSQDSDIQTNTEDHQYSRHSFHRIASFGGFPRFQPFVMSASSPAACIDISSNEETSKETSYVAMSHSVLEYRSSRFEPFHVTP